MTKDTYFEMCDMLGNKPIDSEIPVELDDLPIDVQEAIGIYFKLRDEWDPMSGTYMGKSYVGIADIFDILEVPAQDKKTLYGLIGIIDTHRSKAIADMKPKK